MIPTSIRYDGLRPEPVDPFPLEAEWIGGNALVELTFPTSSRGSLLNQNSMSEASCVRCKVGKGRSFRGERRRTYNQVGYHVCDGRVTPSFKAREILRTRIVGAAYRINVTHTR